LVDRIVVNDLLEELREVGDSVGTTASHTRQHTSRRRGAHHAKVVLRGHDPPVFAAGPKTKSSYHVLLAHSGELEIDCGPVLQHSVALESSALKDARVNARGGG